VRRGDWAAWIRRPTRYAFREPRTPRGGGGTNIRKTIGTGLLAAIAFCALAAPAAARVSCAYSDGGIPFLPQGNVLTVTFNGGDVGQIVRKGTDIRVFDEEDVSIGCTGGPATVANTDTIAIESDPDASEALAILDLGGGQFAPGATDEGDGSSEIEFDVNMQGREGYVFIQGSAGGEQLRFGRNATVPGGNLNAGQEASGPDTDVTLAGVGLAVDGGRGNDTILTGGGAGFDAPLSKGFAFFFGNRGSDRIVGGNKTDILIGGPGRDILSGQAGGDLVVGGPGRDTLFGGPGSDEVRSYRNGSDRVSCGSGRDIAFADRTDSLSGCDRVIRSSGFDFF
jgi:Ca2+-binding RTX toxin-like protein